MMTVQRMHEASPNAAHCIHAMIRAQSHATRIAQYSMPMWRHLQREHVLGMQLWGT